MQGSPDAKKPCKGILKTSSSFDTQAGASHRKSAKFDELNVLQTYHPPDKDYGHMKIEEPKTPYNYADSDANSSDQLDAELLAEKLNVAANTRTSSFDDESSEEELVETDEQKLKRLQFEKRRKAHYNEFEAVKLARKLLEEEDDENDDDNVLRSDDDDDDDKEDNEINSKILINEKSNDIHPSGSGSSQSTDKTMEIEETEDASAQNTSPCSEIKKF